MKMFSLDFGMEPTMFCWDFAALRTLDGLWAVGERFGAVGEVWAYNRGSFLCCLHA